MLTFAISSLLFTSLPLCSFLLFLVNHMDGSTSRCDRASEDRPKDYAVTAPVPSSPSRPPSPTSRCHRPSWGHSRHCSGLLEAPCADSHWAVQWSECHGIWSVCQRAEGEHGMRCEALLCRGRLREGGGDRFSGENLRLFPLQVSASLHEIPAGPSLWGLKSATGLRVRKPPPLLVPTWVRCPLCLPHHCPAPLRTGASPLNSAASGSQACPFSQTMC